MSGPSLSGAFLSVIAWLLVFAVLVQGARDPDVRALMRIKEFRLAWMCLGMLACISWLILIQL